MAIWPVPRIRRGMGAQVDDTDMIVVAVLAETENTGIHEIMTGRGTAITADTAMAHETEMNHDGHLFRMGLMKDARNAMS